MADFESALSELGVALAATDTKLSSSLAEILGVAIQELIEAQLTALIGAEHGERTPTRIAQRNGHRSKTLSTPADDLKIGIPKLRTGSFFPERDRRVQLDSPIPIQSFAGSSPRRSISTAIRTG